MRTVNTVCGIDVAKDTLQACYQSRNKMVNAQFSNTNKGHLQLIRKIGLKRICVMENTGAYSLKIAYALKTEGIDVRVENSLVIKRFIQMNMERHKSDKSDAEWIFRYALEREGKVWAIPDTEKLYGTQLLSAIEVYSRQQIMLNNYGKSIELFPFVCSDVTKSMEKAKTQLKKEKSLLEKKLTALMKKWNRGLYTRLISIPAIGERTVAYLMVLTDCFTKFENHSQLIAFAGLSPREFTSGTSVDKKKGICKMGNRNLRKTLFMCAISAIRSNRPCKEQYQRLTAKGKKSKVALIAVCTKLLKQAFAIATSGLPFDANYKR